MANAYTSCNTNQPLQLYQRLTCIIKKQHDYSGKPVLPPEATVTSRFFPAPNPDFSVRTASIRACFVPHPSFPPHFTALLSVRIFHVFAVSLIQVLNTPPSLSSLLRSFPYIMQPCRYYSPSSRLILQRRSNCNARLVYSLETVSQPCTLYPLLIQVCIH